MSANASSKSHNLPSNGYSETSIIIEIQMHKMYMVSHVKPAPSLVKYKSTYSRKTLYMVQTKFGK
jgi:hypothetical protein